MLTRSYRLHLLGQVSQLHQQFDTDSKEAFSKASCQKGCNACCRLLVLVTRTEAELIVERHRSAVVRALPQLEAQSRELRDLAAAIKADIPNEQDQLSRLQNDWWSRQLPCPLLAKDGWCSVYRSRPFNCRQHAVQGDPADCGSEEPRLATITMNCAPHMGSELERLEAHRTAVGDPTLPGGPLPIVVFEAALQHGLQ